MSARELAIAVAGILLAAKLSAAGAVPLGRAARRGLVRVNARAAAGYSRMAVTIQNTRNEKVTVDVFGSRFVPGRSGVQPLGVARLSVEGGGTELSLSPRQVWRGEFPSFCLKGSASSPRSGLSYALSERPVSQGVKQVFKHWNEHPKITQSAVQAAVWSVSVRSLANAPTRPEDRSPPSPYIRPKRPQVVVLGGLDYLLKTDGRIVMQDHLSAETRDDIELGGDFCAIRRCGGKLCAVRRKREADGYTVHLRNGTTWQDAGAVDVLPESAVLPPGGRPVFFGEGKVYSAEGGGQSMVEAPVAMMSMGRIRDHAAWVCLSRERRLIAFDPRNASPRFAAPGRRFAYYAVGEDIVVYHTGSRLTWERPGLPGGHKNFARDIDRVFLDGERVCVFSDGWMWRMDESDAWVRGPELPADIAGAALDGTTGDLHIVDSTDRLRIYRMADASR